MNTTPAAQDPEKYRKVRYGPNETVPTPRMMESVSVGGAANPVALPGDFILTHSSGIYGKLIRFGQAFRYWGRDKVFAHWSHAAIFVNDAGDIIEALSGGVQQRNISVYQGTEYVVVHLPATTDPLERQHAVAFAEFCLNDPYGWLTIADIALCLLRTLRLSIRVDGQQICSALVARCIERIGAIFAEAEQWKMMPADLAEHFNVQLTGDRGQPPNPDAGVIHFSKPGRRRR